MTDEFYYGEDGQLNPTTTGSCHVGYTYDGQGNLTEISHHGLDNRLIFSSDGYAIMRLDYADGLQKSESYFGVEEEPILGKEGYHKREFLYDRRYNIVEIRLIGTMGQLTLCSDGYALRRLDYDNAGNMTLDAYFDDYKQATYRTGSYSKITMSYDERGHRTLTNWLNPDGTPANQSSYSSQEVKYDSIGREEKVSYYLLDELRLMQEYEYQGNNFSVRTDCWGDSEAGPRRVHRYDERGYEVETADYQGDTLSNRSIREYDEYGNRTQTTLYNASNEQISSIVSSFNSYGYVIGEEFYGEDGLPVAAYGDYHKYFITRENGRSVEIRYYGTDGQLALNHDGYAVETFTYDERGNEIGRAFFDENKEPILLKWRFSRYEVQYDDLGQLVESRFFDTLGREVSQVDGHLSIKLFDINGIPKRMLIFDGDDRFSLMGDLEVKLYIPLQEYVKADDDDTDNKDALSASEEDGNETSSGEEKPSQKTGPEEAPLVFGPGIHPRRK